MSAQAFGDNPLQGRVDPSESALCRGMVGNSTSSYRCAADENQVHGAQDGTVGHGAFVPLMEGRRHVLCKLSIQLVLGLTDVGTT